MLIGYARVSTTDQDTALQLDALRTAGVRTVYHESGSGVGPRPQLHKALRRLCAGDILVVWKLDRVARSLPDLLLILEVLRASGASIRSLTEPMDTSTPLGEFVVQILGAVAQLERSMIRERSIAGQVAAYRRGVRWGGRSPSLTEKQKARVRGLAGRYTHEELAAKFGVSRSTISRAINPPPPRPYTRMPVLSRHLAKACAE